MRPLQTGQLLLSFVALSLTGSLSAHHSHQNYFRGEYTRLQGTITEVHWMNPHSWVYLEVAGDGDESTVWALEGAAMTTLMRKGWTREMVEVGDEISVRCHPLKDGSPACLLGFVTMDTGLDKEFD